MSSIIKLTDVTRTFELHHMRTKAVSGVNLEISSGDYLSIEGASGSGKSTLLNILSLIDKPTEGTVTYYGENAAHLSSRNLAKIRNKKIGFVFQTFNLLGHLTVYDNVYLPMKYSSDQIPDIEQRIDALLDDLKLINRKQHYPHQLSGGQQQRVAIARAVVNDPDIVFADEPTGNLDDSSANDVIGILESLHKRGKTLCIVTHNSGIAMRAHRRIRLDGGKLTEFFVE